ncbi:hypothetical protein BDW22DRAFT_1425840 [Trametopsis cervina]|nr:hypothetical protein BDW22DRAFT_1425840 [Trametopsis cervina]
MAPDSARPPLSQQAQSVRLVQQWLNGANPALSGTQHTARFEYTTVSPQNNLALESPKQLWIVVPINSINLLVAIEERLIKIPLDIAPGNLLDHIKAQLNVPPSCAIAYHFNTNKGMRMQLQSESDMEEVIAELINKTWRARTRIPQLEIINLSESNSGDKSDSKPETSSDEGFDFRITGLTQPTISSVLAALDDVFPSLEYMQYAWSLQEHDIFYAHNAIDFDAVYYWTKIGMADGAIGVFLKAITKAMWRYKRKAKRYIHDKKKRARC